MEDAFRVKGHATWANFIVDKVDKMGGGSICCCCVCCVARTRSDGPWAGVRVGGWCGDV